MASNEVATSNGGVKTTAPARIIDIRSDAAGINLRKEIKAGLNVKDGEDKTLPTLLLYDNEGLKRFEQVPKYQQNPSKRPPLSQVTCLTNTSGRSRTWSNTTSPNMRFRCLQSMRTRLPIESRMGRW